MSTPTIAATSLLPYANTQAMRQFPTNFAVTIETCEPAIMVLDQALA